MTDYHLPWGRLPAVSRDLLAGRRRSLRADCAAMVARLQPAPRLAGVGHIPANGPFVLVANHYQRRDLWIGWAGALLTHAVACRRGGDPPVHWLVLGGLACAGRPEPLTSWAFPRVAHNWGMVPLPRYAGPAARAVAVARFVHLALPLPRGRGRPVGLFPEGERGGTGPPGPARPGTGSLLLLLARAGVPTLPAAVWEASDRRLCARFGTPFWPRAAAPTPSGRDTAAGAQAMAAIRALLADSTSHMIGHVL
jgi:1-acyl-sn-glycerol-3-phosphate acyltransferase